LPTIKLEIIPEPFERASNFGLEIIFFELITSEIFSTRNYNLKRRSCKKYKKSSPFEIASNFGLETVFWE
jgi:hypothetical protein